MNNTQSRTGADPARR